MITRRHFVTGAIAASGLPFIPRVIAGAGAAVREFSLKPAPASASLVGGKWPDTKIWAYNGAVPGPEIRIRQGERLRVVAGNGLDEPTTIHWHGVRLPIAMDGVPGLTQDAIEPDGEFVYEFDALDAGSFWYHPHANSAEQVGRGLSGPLIIEEHEPIRVDRDVTWVLDDWLLTEDAQINDSFGHPMQMSHGGRLGNTVTLNGAIRNEFGVRAGERLRLRLINVSNARTFGLDFGGLDPQVIAFDGQPVAPFAAPGGRVTVAAAQRVDLVLDLDGKPGERASVVDNYYRGRAYELLDIVYSDEAPLRDSPLDAPIALPANPVPEPLINDQALRETIILQGGAMGTMPAGARAHIERNKFWFLNGEPAMDHDMKPLFAVERGRTCIVKLVNETQWEHPMHLHGFAFRVLSRNGKPSEHREWRDTELVRPQETIEIAFVADNPGKWMFHCHILEHQMAGMSGIVNVA